MTVAVAVVAVHVAVVAVAVTLVVAAAWLVTVCACCCPQATPSAPPCVPLATAKVFKKVGKNLRLPRLSSLRFRAQARAGLAWCLAHADTFTLSRSKQGGTGGGGKGVVKGSAKGALQHDDDVFNRNLRLDACLSVWQPYASARGGKGGSKT